MTDLDPLHPSIYSIPLVSHPTDNVPSDTLTEQQETENFLSEVLRTVSSPYPGDTRHRTIHSEYGDSEDLAPTILRRSEHQKFLAATLFRLPAAYVALDASRPWLLFWTIHSMDLLGIGLDEEGRRRGVSTLMHFLSPLGGFAGGPANTQLPHLLPTYASTCSLAILGHAGEGGGWDKLAEIRQCTYNFFMECKRPDGGFVVCQGGELDVRGTYCLLVVATLLDILTPELLHNVDQYIAACQTYEGGFANSAFSFGSADHFRSPPTAEAHGGYTSCSLLTHFLLASISHETGNPSLPDDFPKSINVKKALRWSALMQGEAIEAGGFRGRSNKLVDGCYSWWVGGGFPVLEALLQRSEGDQSYSSASGRQQLFDNIALQEYILIAAQREEGKGGGLRDKPPKRPDLYHTCNNLSGLAIAQHHMFHSADRVQANRERFDSSRGLPPVQPKDVKGGWRSEEERQRMRKEVWANALGWVDLKETVIGGKENRVNATTPVFNILPQRLAPFINYFYGQS